MQARREDDVRGTAPATALPTPADPLPTGLKVYAGAIILVGTGIIAAVVATTPIDPAIALPFDIGPVSALLLGVCFWLAFGLEGSLRSTRLASGAVITFHLPFVVAATAIGGPAMGVWMGLISEFEVREFREAPWWGVLTNHVVVALAAIAAGFGGNAVDVLIGGSISSELLTLVHVAVVGATFIAVNTCLVIPILTLRWGISLLAAARSYDLTVRATFAPEIILAWLMVATWRSIAWWAPMLSASLVLVIWWAHDKALDLTRDPMTGILNERGFRPRLNRAIQEARLHSRLSLLAILDLDQFKEVNDHYGHDAGDEVIRVTARRLTAATRATDAVSRSHRAGDEFAVLLEGVKDASLAETLARRLHDRLCEPIVLREDGRRVGVGASIGVVVLDGTVASADEAVRIADWRMYEAKIGQLGVVATGWPPGEAPAAGDQAKASAS